MGELCDGRTGSVGDQVMPDGVEVHAERQIEGLECLPDQDTGLATDLEGHLQHFRGLLHDLPDALEPLGLQRVVGDRGQKQHVDALVEGVDMREQVFFCLGADAIRSVQQHADRGGIALGDRDGDIGAQSDELRGTLLCTRKKQDDQRVVHRAGTEVLGVLPNGDGEGTDLMHGMLRMVFLQNAKKREV